MKQLEHDITAEPIEGFRIFGVSVDKLRLTALTNGALLFVPGPNQSVCRLAGGHTVHEPTERCTCGYHAVKSRRLINRTYPGLAINALGREDQKWYLFPRPRLGKTAYVSARVKMWGRVIEHEFGYRAQWAEVIPETITWWPRRNFKHNNNLLIRLREEYNVDG